MKLVRVENADAGTEFRVVVEAWERGRGGLPDVLVFAFGLDRPADMTHPSLYITNTRYLVVKEAEVV